MCKFFNITPMQLGEMRKKDPSGVRFIELTMIHRAKEDEKKYKEIERKSKQRKSGRKR